MQNFCLKLADSPLWYALAKSADMAMFIVGAAIISTLFFRSRREKNLWRYIAVASLIIFDGVFQSLCIFGVIRTRELHIHVETLIPFICAFALFFSLKTAKQIYKPIVSVFIYNIVPVISQVTKMFIPWINSDNSEAASSFGVDFLTDGIIFALLLLFCIIYAEKKGREFAFDKIDLSLYILIILTISIFIASLMFIDRYIKDTQVNNAYFILLLNVPTFAFTIAYASRKMVRSRIMADSYKMILDENIRHYESLEEKNEELRIFRHDFPKTITPILMCIEDNNTDEAKKILEKYNQIVQSTKPRFATGNHRLDNVLETEYQKAAKVGITIELQKGSVFPNYGINPIDIYTIFPNVLDNAIEACEKVSGEKIIKVDSKIAGNAVYVSVSNPFNEGEIKRTRDGFVTTKKDSSLHGFGTKSIKKAVAKYGEDNIFFETENGIFTVSFSLEFESDQ